MSQPFWDNMLFFFLLFNLRWAQLYISIVALLYSEDEKSIVSYHNEDFVCRLWLADSKSIEGIIFIKPKYAHCLVAPWYLFMSVFSVFPDKTCRLVLGQTS